MCKKTVCFLAVVIMLIFNGCGKEADSNNISLIGTSALEDTAPEYPELISLLENQHELELFMETQWEKREGLDTWEDFASYAQTVYTKDYVDYFFTPKYFGKDSSYYNLDEQGNLIRRETDGIVFEVQSNTLFKMTHLENAYAVIQELETDSGTIRRIFLLVHTKDGFRIYAQLEED